MTEPAATAHPPRVALFVTCLANVFRPAVAEASVQLLRAAGCDHPFLGVEEGVSRYLKQLGPS